MSVDLEKIGRRIAEERKILRKISQEKMAEDLGLYQADISNLEHARKGSGITDLLRLDDIASYFDISLESLIFGSGKEKDMVHYFGKKMEIKRIPTCKKLTKKQCTRLAELTDNPISKIETMAVTYTCGPYTIHILTETQGVLSGRHNGQLQAAFQVLKPHLYVFLENELIACAVATCANIGMFIYEPYFKFLQSIVQPDVLDISDALRYMNPFQPLYMYGDESESKQYQAKMYQRMDELRSIHTEPVLFIESVYVLEDYRKHGICRLLMDVMKELVGNCTLWLNMEPTAGEELFSYTPYFPTYTQAELGQLSMNASIAEKLGFTIDPDCWHGLVEVFNENAPSDYQEVEYRKCAFILSDSLRQIIQNDGDLVAIGRAKQKLSQAANTNNSINSISNSILDLKTERFDNGYIAELRSNDQGIVTYIFCIATDDQCAYFGASHHSPITEGMCIEIIDDCGWYEDKPDSPFYDTWKLLFMMVPKHSPEDNRN